MQNLIRPGRALLALGITVSALAAPAAFAVAPMGAVEDLLLSPAGPSVVSAQDLSRSGAMPVAAAWESFESVTLPGWVVVWNEATGLPHRALPGGFDAAARAGVVPAGMIDADARASYLDAATIDQTSRQIYETLRSSFPTLPAPQTLAPFAIEQRGSVWFAIYQQTEAGLPVEGARADFRYSRDGKLLSVGLSLIPGTLPEVAPLVSLDEAQAMAIDALVEGGLGRAALSAAASLEPVQAGRRDREAWVAAGPDRNDRMIWMPHYSADGREVETRLAYVVRTEVTEPMSRFVSYVDARTGEILKRDNEVRYVNYTGHADSEVQPATPQDPFVNLAQPDLRVSVAGVGEAFTNANGDFTLTNGDNTPRFLTSALTGRWARIIDATGAEPALTTLATPGVPTTVHFSDANSQASERDCYHHMNVVHSWVKQVTPSYTGVDYEMTGTVNINQTCNANWDGSGINFFKQGGGCTNTAQIADVVYHEYGHGNNQFSYAPASPTGAQHEGFADYHGATITNQPDIGRGFYGANTILRTCDNNRQYPSPECGGEVHCDGEVIAGALWHMRENLVAVMGQSAGVAHSDHLFHIAMFGRDATYEGYYFDLLAVDDDNGTLADGTPHDNQIIPAFDQHNIGPGFTLEIVHAQLRDTENTTNPYVVSAVLSSPADVITSASLFYKTGPIGGPFSSFIQIPMSPGVGVRVYQASIPAQPLGTEVRYYLSGGTALPTLAAVSPTGAPTNTFGFKIETDATLPVVTYNPLFDKCAASWPAVISAVVTDNQSVSSVEVEWKLDGIDQPNLSLAQIGTGSTYAGPFTGSVSEGQVISYRVKASDSAQIPNVTRNPASGYNTFTIVHDFAENGEHGVQDLTHTAGTLGFNDQWHLSTARNHTPAGTTSWKFGDTGGGNYLDSSDGTLVTPEIHLGSAASLSFWHWIAAENDANNTAWDGASVELSIDNGASWSQITPAGGYTHTIIDNPACPFPAGYPVWSGFFDWRQAEFDLSAFVGQHVRIRFRFGSDGAVNYEGWYVDDIVLDPGAQSADVLPGTGVPGRSALFGAAPNPFAPSTQIRFAVAAGTGPVSLEIIDVSGRRVRTLLDGPATPGYHAIAWDGRDNDGRSLAGGVYFARLSVDGDGFTSKLLRIR